MLSTHNVAIGRAHQIDTTVVLESLSQVRGCFDAPMRNTGTSKYRMCSIAVFFLPDIPPCK